MMPEQRLEELPSFWEARLATMAQQRRMPAFAHAPRWLRETLIFPYLAGADFVRWFRTTHPGRQPYGAAMPVSTEQILHPDRYAAGDAPLELAFVAPSPDTVRYEDDRRIRDPAAVRTAARRQYRGPGGVARRWLGRRPLSDSGTGVRGAGMVFGLGQLR